MSHFRKDPYRTDRFWKAWAIEKLQSTFLSAAYRRRILAIFTDADKRLGKVGTEGGHYPRERT